MHWLQKSRVAILCAIVAICAVAFGSWLSFQRLAEQTRQETIARLTAVADLKAAEISAWLSERRGDAAYLSRDPTFAAAVSRWMRKKSQTDRDDIEKALRLFGSEYGYASVELIDPAGLRLLGDGRLLSRDQTRIRIAQAVGGAGGIAFDDLHRHPDENMIQMGFGAPVADRDGSLLATLFLDIDPYRHLYRRLQDWPLPSRTGETLLVRRDGENLVYLNPLRHSLADPLTQIRSAHDAGLPFALYMQGQSAGEAHDYRNVPIFFAVRAIPDTSWLLVAKEDRKESLRRLRSPALQIAAVGTLAIISVLSVLYLLRRHGQWQAVRRELRHQLALRRAEARFRGAFEQAAVGIAHIGLDGRLLDVNRRLCELLGRDRSALTGQSLKSVFPGAFADADAECAESLLDGTIDKFQKDMPFERENRSALWLHVTISLFRGADDAPEYFIWVFEDITQRRAAEGALERSESRFRSLFEYSPIALCEEDFSAVAERMAELRRQGTDDIGAYLEAQPDEVLRMASAVRFLDVNQATVRLLGLSSKEQVMRDLPSYFTSDSLKVFRRQLIDMAGGKLFLEREIPVLTPAGEPLWLTLHFAMQPGHERDWARALVSLTDITERKRAEDIRIRYASIVECSEDAIIGTTLDGVVTSWNPGAERIFGYSAEEVSAKPIDSIVPDELLEEERDILRRICTNLPIHHYESVRRRKDGRSIDVSISVSPLRNADGQIVGISKIARDITERKRMEKELLALNSRLEARVAERTAELARKTLDLEAANRAKSLFLSNMSHEIRTPMNAILGLSHILLSTELTPGQQGYLRTILKAGESLMALLGDILDFVQAETGNLHIESQAFELAALLDRGIGAFARKIEDKSLRARVEIAPDAPRYVYGDAKRIGQILGHLLDNAVKFTERGEIEVGVRVASRVQDRIALRFWVRDSGVGLSVAQCGRLFETFEQGDASSTRRHGGVGLGLAICKRLVELMGGEIGVESALGEGSAFWFVLPLQPVFAELQGGGADGRASSESRPENAGARLRSAADVGEPASLDAVCADLAALLAEDNFSAGPYARRHEALLQASFGEDYPPIAEAIGEFDFENGLQRLKRAAAKRSIVIV